MYEGACMSAQHKTLPDGMGAGHGWIMTKTDGEGQVFTGQTSGVESTTADRNHLITPEATTIPIAAEHIHETAATKWIPAAAVETTNRRMAGRGDRKIGVI